MTLLVLDVVGRLKRNPLPYLLAIATASNIGSVATITGNPQNIIIGSLSGIPYATFAAALALAPVAGFGLLVTILLIALVYRAEFFNGALPVMPPRPPRYRGPLLIKTVLVVAAMVTLFFLGQPAKVATALTSPAPRAGCGRPRCR